MNIQAGRDITAPVHIDVHHPTAPVSRSAAMVEAVTAASVDAVFTGRDDHVQELLAALNPDAAGAGAVVVSAGMGGVGKTALAKHCAAHAAAAGWFQGGVFTVDMLGYAAAPVAAEAVFSPLLRRLGVPPEHIPADPADAHTVYHQTLTQLAAEGRRMLLVVDNASASAQVRPLLPAAGGGHVVVVTTRDTLALPARRLPLDVLDEPTSIHLLTTALHTLDPHDRRLTGDPEGALELARACGGLPLALRVVVPLLAAEHHLSPGKLATQLRAAPGVEGYTYGEQAVAAALDLSWQRLLDHHPDQAHTLRLICLVPGPDLSTETAAALTDHPEAAVRTRLRGLRDAHLLRPNGLDRWTLHDLVRAHTITRTPPGLDPDHLTTAVIRLLEHYATTAQQADAHLRALPGNPVPDRFTSRDHALDWFDSERANLLAVIAAATATANHDDTVHFSLVLANYLLWRHHTADLITTATTAHASAKHLTLHHQASTATNLGNALQQVRRFEEAVTAHEHALALHQKIGDRHGEGMAWNNLGLALLEIGRFEEAITACKHARTLYQEMGDRHKESTAWSNLGVALERIGQFEKAITAHEHALALHQETGDRHGEGIAWANLGLALQRVGQFKKAITAHKHAHALYQETGDRHGEGIAWTSLGRVLHEVGRLEEAVTGYERARTIHQETGYRHDEGIAWGNLGLALVQMRRFEEGAWCYAQARAAFTDTGDLKRAEGLARLVGDIAGMIGVRGGGTAGPGERG